MAAVDVFCSADDRHRVILLVELLERAGCGVTLHSETISSPSDPCLVAVTRRSLREPWVEKLFAQAPGVAAMRLDDSPLPWPAARVIDLQAWPARSADRKVVSLVQWLQLRQGDLGEPAASRGSRVAEPGAGAASGSAAGSQVAAGSLSAVAGATGRRARRAGDIRVRAGDPGSQRWNGLLALGLLVGAVYGLIVIMPEDRGPAAPGPSDASAQQSVAEPSSEIGIAVSSSSVGGGTVADGRIAGALQGSARPELLQHGGPPQPQDMLEALPEPAALAVPGVDMPVRRHRDALARLCEARTPDAARAWAGALNWKQRRRLPAEPCVRALLQRPQFRELAAKLQVR